MILKDELFCFMIENKGMGKSIVHIIIMLCVVVTMHFIQCFYW